MGIKNKDGSDYKLRGPNTQPFLPKLNIEPTPISAPLEEKKEEEKEIEVFIPLEGKKEKKEEWDITQVQLINFDWETTVEKPVPVEKPVLNPYEKLQTIFVCMPLLVEDVQKEIIVKGYILSRNDLQLIFWANVELPIGTIVLPKDQTKKWWKIDNIEKKEKGSVYYSIVSDISKFW